MMENAVLFPEKVHNHVHAQKGELKSQLQKWCSHLGVHGVCFGSPLQTGGVKGHSASLATLQHLGMFFQYLLSVEREGVGGTQLKSNRSYIYDVKAYSPMTV